MSLPYFLSSQETGYELEMLRRFDVELLIGQVSYQQKADIYNISNGYDTTKKYCSTTKKAKPANTQPPHGYVNNNIIIYIYKKGQTKYKIQYVVMWACGYNYSGFNYSS